MNIAYLGLAIACVGFGIALFEYLRTRKERKRTPQQGVLVSETDEGKLYAELAADMCPDCGHRGFYEGPSGGMSTNIFCMNPKCRSGFNVTPVVEIAERIHKGDLSMYPKEK